MTPPTVPAVTPDAPANQMDDWPNRDWPEGDWTEGDWSDPEVGTGWDNEPEGESAPAEFARPAAPPALTGASGLPALRHSRTATGLPAVQSTDVKPPATTVIFGPKRPPKRRYGGRLAALVLRRPLLWAVNLVLFVVLFFGVALPRLSPAGAGSDCASTGHGASSGLCLSIPFTSKSPGVRIAPFSWNAHAGSVVPPTPTPGGPAYFPLGYPQGEPCTGDRSIVWTIAVSRWAIPPGCFGQIYHPNPMDYLYNGHEILPFGYCEWWPEALLRNNGRYPPTSLLGLPWHKVPKVGVPIWYNTVPVGHYAFVESIGTGRNAGWILISEMNMWWRGGGYAAVDYRYIRVDYPGAEYLYPNN
jgi:hypothetical protein